MKIFLVEDEVYALRALEQKILDLDEGHEVIGTASDGRTALAEIERLCPDVVMTDIRMPDIDGIEMLTLLEEKDVQPVTVIISGFQEFEYAKKAVKLGVNDYLLKPVQQSELKLCLERCKEKLQASRKKENVISILLESELSSLPFTQKHPYYYVIYAVITNPLSDFNHFIHPNIAYNATNIIENLLCGALPPKAECSSSEGVFTNEKVFILGCSLPQTELEDILSATAAKTHSEGIGYITMQYAVFTSADVLPQHVLQCRRNAVHSVRLGEDVISFGEPQGSAKKSGDINQYIRVLAHLLRGGEQALLQSNLAQMLDEWRQNNLPLFAVQRNLVFVLNSLKSTLDIKEEMNFDSTFCVENIISFCGGYAELAEGFATLLLEMFSSREAAKAADGKELVKNVIDFYEKNLNENISLQMLAEQMNISKVYLCRVFKQHKNTTPIDYFTHMKIEKAKEMLVQYPTMPIREISDSLGFNDMYYFSKVFKRIAGCPPSEMRGG